MGGGIAMQYAYRTPRRLAAVFAISSYMTHRAAVYDVMRQQPRAAAPFPPLFQRHGAADDFILPQWGRATADRLAALGVSVDFGTVPRLRHELSAGEVEELTAFLRRALATSEAAQRGQQEL